MEGRDGLENTAITSHLALSLSLGQGSHTHTHTHTHTHSLMVPQDRNLLMEGRVIPVVCPLVCSCQITFRKGEEGSGVRNSVGWQHHQLVRQTLQVVHQRIMLLLLGHVTEDDVIHYS